MKYELEIDRDKVPFSRRCADVVEKVLAGNTRDAAAETLHMARSTVNTHLEKAFAAYGVDNLQQLALILYTEGIAKGKRLLVFCLVICGGGNAVLPSNAYARDLVPRHVMQEQGRASFPINRLRVRGGSRLRSGTQLRLRQQTRRRDE